MTRLTPPPDRNDLEKRIHQKFEMVRGSMRDFAQFSGVDASLVSKRLSPDCDTHTSSFVQVVFDLSNLRLVSPDLAWEIWKEICLEVEKLFGSDIRNTGKFTDLTKTINNLSIELIAAKADGEPAHKLISIGAEIQNKATDLKNELIGMRNETHFAG